MSHAKTPWLKKQDRYDKDHRVDAEHPKAFRKGWPLKKARAKRRARHAGRTALLTATEGGFDQVASDIRVSLLREPAKKSGVMPLREFVSVKRERREARIGQNARNAAAAARWRLNNE